MEYGIDKQGQPGNSLHGQHQEGMHGKRLAHWRRLKAVEHLYESGIVLSESLILEITDSLKTAHLYTVPYQISLSQFIIIIVLSLVFTEHHDLLEFF